MHNYSSGHAEPLPSRNEQGINIVRVALFTLVGLIYGIVLASWGMLAIVPGEGSKILLVLHGCGQIVIGIIFGVTWWINYRKRLRAGMAIVGAKSP